MLFSSTGICTFLISCANVEYHFFFLLLLLLFSLICNAGTSTAVTHVWDLDLGI